MTGYGSETTGPSSVEGVGEFNGSNGGNDYSCTITEATLTLQREPAQRTDNLTPFCQCTEPRLRGTRAATRVDVSSAAAKR
jgi:hypothetical protein